MNLPEKYVGVSLSTTTHNANDLIKRYASFIIGIQNTLKIEIPNETNIQYNKFLKNELTEDEKQDLVEEFENILDSIAPDNCYFGANEGDGADFGFWELE